MSKDNADVLSFKSSLFVFDIKSSDFFFDGYLSGKAPAITDEKRMFQKYVDQHVII